MEIGPTGQPSPIEGGGDDDYTDLRAYGSTAGDEAKELLDEWHRRSEEQAPNHDLAHDGVGPAEQLVPIDGPNAAWKVVDETDVSLPPEDETGLGRVDPDDGGPFSPPGGWGPVMGPGPDDQTSPGAIATGSQGGPPSAAPAISGNIASDVGTIPTDTIDPSDGLGVPDHFDLIA